ncbi:hypothetical protein [Arsenophonus nasoniae]|uniref:hypothetical protein n=1 Tax=Arsenophonus nasoniae TaxID=638 RepID=UPI0038795401
MQIQVTQPILPITWTGILYKMVFCVDGKYNYYIHNNGKQYTTANTVGYRLVKLDLGVMTHKKDLRGQANHYTSLYLSL